jgi:hypothetical protein
VYANVQLRAPASVFQEAKQEPVADSLVFLMIGRDAADGQVRLTPLFRCFDIRWKKSDSAKLFADMEKAAGELAGAAEPKSFFALDAGPLSKFITVHPQQLPPRLNVVALKWPSSWKGFQTLSSARRPARSLTLRGGPDAATGPVRLIPEGHRRTSGCR